MSVAIERLEPVGEATVYTTEIGITAVIVCEFCGQPLGSLADVCNSAIHVGTDGSGAGRAVTSTALAERARGRA
jgi:hypothetical protein